MHKSMPIHKNKAVTDYQKIYNHRSVFETVACMLLMCCRSVGKHSSLGRPQKLDRVDLFGKNLIPMEKL